MRELGLFTTGIGGMAWASFGLSEEALAVIGAIGLAIGIFCAGYQWGRHRKKDEHETNPSNS